MLNKKMTQNNQQLKLDSQNPVIYDNTRSEVISVMPDTLDNKLRDFEEGIKNKGRLFDDFFLVLAFLATLVTVSQFRDFLNISGSVWQAVFLVSLFLSVIKLCRDVYNNFIKKSLKREDILKQLLDETRKKK